MSYISYIEIVYFKKQSKDPIAMNLNTKMEEI